MAKTLGIPKENVRLISPYIGGGFGGKLFLRFEALLAALGAKRGRPSGQGGAAARAHDQQHHAPPGDDPAHPHRRHARRPHHGDRPRKLVGRPAGRPAGNGGQQTRLLYAGANRLTTQLRLAVLDLPEGNAMRAPGEAPGMMALEIAIDEMAEKLKMDPVTFRIVNDTTVDPEKREPQVLAAPLRRMPAPGRGTLRLEQAQCAVPGKVREGRWLIGMGVASAFRNNLVT
jgi:xanthine dehydrogenase YagR molybdenum-binding subunit